MVVLLGLKCVSSEANVCFCVSVTLNCGMVYHIVARHLQLSAYCSAVVGLLSCLCGFFKDGFIVGYLL